MSENVEGALSTVRDVGAARQESEAGSLSAWQNRLLPFMMITLLLLTLFACVANVVEAYSILNHIEDEHNVNSELKPALNMLDANSPGLSPEDRIAYVRWKTLALLEVNSIESRYHQAAIAVVTRVYNTFLSFLTGVVLSLVGAAFILGKLREPQTTAGAGGGNFQLSIASTSPGLILAMLGTTLMVVAVVSKGNVSVRDSALYLNESTVFTVAPEPNGEHIKTTTSAHPSGLTPQQKQILDHVQKTLGKPDEMEGKANP